MSGDKSRILAEYIKKGWVLTDLECPKCGSLLLKKGEKYFCAVCNQEVYVVDSEEKVLSIIEKDIKEKIRGRLVEELHVLYSASDFSDYEVLNKLKFYLELLKELEE